MWHIWCFSKVNCMQSRGHCILVHIITIALLCSVTTSCLAWPRSSVLGIGEVTFVTVWWPWGIVEWMFDHGEPGWPIHQMPVVPPPRTGFPSLRFAEGGRGKGSSWLADVGNMYVRCVSQQNKIVSRVLGPRLASVTINRLSPQLYKKMWNASRVWYLI